MIDSLEKPSRRPRMEVADPSRIERLPAHSIESEQGILGCVFLAADPKLVMADILTGLKTAEAFYDLRHRTMFECLCDMVDFGDAIDIITFTNLLRNRQQLEAVGGMAYISSLADAVPFAANLDYYLKIVQDKYLRRRLIQTCTDIIGRLYDSEETPIAELLGEAEKQVLSIGTDNATDKDITIKEYVRQAICAIEECHQRQGATIGIATGLTDLDKLCYGLQPGDYFIIAGRPSQGKTAISMNIAEYVAVDLKQPVGVFSLEMTGKSLVIRMLLSRARVNMTSVMDGFMTERDFPKITGSASKISNANIHICDISGLSILQLRAKARRMWQQYGIKLFVIDYIQLLHSTNKKAETRQQEISDISSGIKCMAKELGVPVIAISQLNREMEREKNRRPRLSDLRESGSLENDGDKIGLLWPRKDEENEDEQRDCYPVTLVLAKHRNGPTGDVNLTFFKSITRFENAAKVSGDTQV
jgi:replicative DNA helicase